MSQVTKLLLKIVMDRMKGKIEAEFGKEHGKEEHATSINTIPLQISHYSGVFCVESMKSPRVARVFTLA